MKKDVKDIIQKEETHLNNLLEQEDLSAFKGMVDELRDTWTKKQMFRTETEARFSVLQDNRYPTKAAKYWQCVREQSSYLDNLMSLSFDYRSNEAKIKWLEGKVEKEKDEYKTTKYQIDLDECRFAKASMEKTARHRMREIKMWSKLKKEFNDGSFNEKDEYKATKYQIDIDECRFAKASMEKVAKHRMREIKMWSGLKKEFNDGSFNDKDVNQHQLESYGMQYAEKARQLTENSSDTDKFNVLGQLQSLQRIRKSGELENSYKEKEQLEQHGKPKV